MATTSTHRPGFRLTRRMVYIALAFVLGSLLGVGLFTFGYANGASYLSSDAKACVNCHVMQENYDGWEASVHGKVATCNDCHAPHDLVGKYLTKAENGFRHALAFTTGNFPDDIQIRERNKTVTEGACLSCHEEMVSTITATHGDDAKPSCIKCHRNVGHL